MWLPERLRKKQKQDRIVIPMAQAVELLEVGKKNKVWTFWQVKGQRVHALRDKDEVIQVMDRYSMSFGGVEIAGDIARHHGFGLTCHMGDIVRQLPQSVRNKMPLGWIFLKTIDGVCCHCAGKGKVARQAFQIVASKCGTCGGTGTYDMPGDNIFAQELRNLQANRKGKR